MIAKNNQPNTEVHFSQAIRALSLICIQIGVAKNADIAEKKNKQKKRTRGFGLAQTAELKLTELLSNRDGKYK